ncbi:hypothetical protein [Knoellia aerolata]|uniref:Uncharacterized protein n=1 Tax=Knoellia aerolata DSM 18566 TaxID=1385519 RepID=A0A0A0JYV5_9MICO|nr:hypothetical protein [Knoellia aerolata]KGN41909.1 hypothetical protein N801_04285 [Knoellia aerolata DSM 18566]
MGAPVLALGGLTVRGGTGAGLRAGAVAVAVFVSEGTGDDIAEGDRVGVPEVEVLGVGGVDAEEDEGATADALDGAVPASFTGPPQPWARSRAPAATRAAPTVPSARRDAGTRAVPSGTARSHACLSMNCVFNHQRPSDQC